MLLAAVVELPANEEGGESLEVPLSHELRRPDPAQTGVEPTKVLQTELVKETPQSPHVKSLRHLPEAEKDCLQ